MGKEFVGLRPPARFKAIQSRHDGIHQHQIRGDLVNQIESAGSVRCYEDRKACASRVSVRKPSVSGVSSTTTGRIAPI
jgi:hypothetical protein